MNEPSIFKQQTPLDVLAQELPPDKDQMFMQETPEGPSVILKCGNLLRQHDE